MDVTFVLLVLRLLVEVDNKYNSKSNALAANRMTQEWSSWGRLVDVNLMGPNPPGTLNP